ncbi:MAG: alkaline phosphatase family protein, partial [Candidatus Cybelea sp.]
VSVMQPATRADVTPVLPAAGNPVSKYIKHVVVIIQENRSFENFFAGYPGADAPMFGCAGPSGLKSRRPNASCPVGDTVVPLHSITFDSDDPAHNWHSSVVDWDNGNMDGFYTEGAQDAAYSYVARGLITPYWTLAQQYVLADHMFPTEFGGSFTGHLTLIAGTDNLKPWLAEVDYPNGSPDDCDSPPGTRSSTINRHRRESRFTGPFPCFNEFRTMAQDLDTAGVSWKYYVTKVLDAGLWEPFEAIKYVRYGNDWHQDIIAPQTLILTDPADGKLAQVSWVSPSKQDSDHPGGQGHRAQGPLWVASIVNAIGESSYWNSTAIIVVWDDWGGFYDNVPPPQLDFRGLGIRVPCLIISPYAKRGYVSHTGYEYGSILKFIEEAFKLPALGPVSEGYTDSRANSIDDSFDFLRKPRPFTPILTSHPPSYFLSEPPSNEPVDTE